MEDAADSLTISATSVPAGITVTNITKSNGTVTATITAACNTSPGSNIVTLQVQDSGGKTATATFTVSVSANTAPVLGTYNNVSMTAGTTANATPSAPPSDNGTLTVTASGPAGAGTLTANSTTGSIQIANPTAGTYTVTVTATDNCGATATQTFQLNVIAVFGAPPGFAATASTASQVGLSWNAVSGNSVQYEIWRTVNLGTAFAPYTTTASTSYNDTGVAANTTYLYKVRAIDGMSTSAFTPVDAATTTIFTDSSLTGVNIKAVHITQLRTAVNAMRAAATLSATTFTDSSLSGVAVKVLHITQLRTALNEARSAIGLSALTYTDPAMTPASTTIKQVHIQELRNGVK
jgi:hypothetical protein